MVDCIGLENRRTERYRGFESLPLRKKRKLKGFLFFTLEGMRTPEWGFVIDEVACQSKNPSLSAEINLQDIDFQSCRFLYAQKDAPKTHQNPVLTSFLFFWFAVSSVLVWSILCLTLCDFFGFICDFLQNNIAVLPRGHHSDRPRILRYLAPTHRRSSP